MDICPLRELEPDELEEVFLEEAQQWNEQLYWDYRPTLKIIKSYASSRSLPGFVLKQGAIPMGYSYFIVDRPVAFIGNVFVRQQSAFRESYRDLLRKTTDSLFGMHSIQRIESQVFPFNFDIQSVFAELGFKVLARTFLSLELKPNKLAQLDSSERSHGYTFLAWRPEFLRPASEVIFDSYTGSPDLELCRDYRSPVGCARFLRNLVENPVCGRFSPEDTKIAVDQTGRICGLLLAAYIRPDTGMVPQLSIRMDCQGQGLGSSLLMAFCRSAYRRGARRLTLSVTDSNLGARRLYERLGFRAHKAFQAFVWEAQNAQ
jgi:ribosomal protein S18 acetylase RimI-like enzyme